MPHVCDVFNRLRITQLTDLHVGSILTPDMLPEIVRAVNEIKSEMIVVTGDLFDCSIEHLDIFIDVMSQMVAPLGVYYVLGNHDHREDAEKIRRAFAKGRLTLLTNENRRVWHKGASIAIGGIDWPNGKRKLRQYVEIAADGMCEADMSVLLSHHPDAFDVAQKYNIDLTIAGHTHGGQWLIRKQHSHNRRSIGLANIRWRYAQGVYRKSNSTVFVSSGLGGSFPIRFRCPAEISVLEVRVP